MNRLCELFYWLEHGFSLPRAWELSGDPQKPVTPAWKVYATAGALSVAVVSAAICSIF